MGVAGCGKSSLGVTVANQLDMKIVEGDDHHSAENLKKMSLGIPLKDADRDGWLATLEVQLQSHLDGIVLTCSALKRAYRDRLRGASPGLRFIYLDISPEQALSRVTQRAASHFFSTSLVDSQFTTLESPVGEPGVLQVDASAPLATLQKQVCDWLVKDSGSAYPTNTFHSL